MGKFERLLARIAEALKDARISYMVIGAQAVLVYGRPRFTGDIDITLGVDVEQLSRLKKIAEEISLRPLRPDFEQFAMQTNVFSVVEDATKIKVDFIFSFSPYEREAIKRVKPIEIQQTTVYYASPEDVVIHKIVAGRPLDIEDAKSIINVQPSLDRSYILKWLREYSDVVSRDLEKQYHEMEQHVLQSKRN
jgi:hypothetical protein